jgi:hypothetical protein
VKLSLLRVWRKSRKYRVSYRLSKSNLAYTGNAKIALTINRV